MWVINESISSVILFSENKFRQQKSIRRDNIFVLLINSLLLFFISNSSLLCLAMVINTCATSKLASPIVFAQSSGKTIF